MAAFLDIRRSVLCPNCRTDVYKHIWDKKNVLSVSDKFDYYDVDGFQTYRNATYKCPACGMPFYTRVRSNDSIFKNNH